MANKYYSGSVFIDTSGAQVVSRGAKVAYILFNTHASGDTITLYDGDANTDPKKIIVKGDNAHKPVLIDFSRRPLVFNDGIYVEISANCTATLVLTSEGAGGNT